MTIKYQQIAYINYIWLKDIEIAILVAIESNEFYFN